MLVIALPNPAGFDAEHFKENWVAWDAPRHLYHFWPGTLEKLLATHKLSVFKRQPYFPDAVYNSFHSEALRYKRDEGVGRRQLAVRIMKSVFSPFRILNLLGRAGVDALQGGSRASSVVYYARRVE